MKPRAVAACALLPLAMAWPWARAAVDLVAMWDYARPALSESRFRAALAVAQGDDALVLRTQLARSLGLQRRFDEAHAELDAVQAEGNAAPEVKVRLRLERGRALRSAGRAAEALPHFEQASEMAQAAGLQGLAADALHMVPLALPAGAAQMAAHRRLLDYVRAAQDPTARQWEGQGLNNMANAQRAAGQLDEALVNFRASREVFERQGSESGERIARWQVAQVLRLLGRVAEALVMQQQLEAEHQRAGTRDIHVFNELALLYTAQGDAQRAGVYRGLAAQMRSATP